MYVGPKHIPKIQSPPGILGRPTLLFSTLNAYPVS